MNKPIIGIVNKKIIDTEGREAFFTNKNICEKIIKNGGIPITLNDTILKNDNEKPENITVDDLEDNAIQQIKLCDGIILQGGINYSVYEVNVAKYLIDKDIPVLGICCRNESFNKSWWRNFFKRYKSRNS